MFPSEYKNIIHPDKLIIHSIGGYLFQLVGVSRTKFSLLKVDSRIVLGEERIWFGYSKYIEYNVLVKLIV